MFLVLLGFFVVCPFLTLLFDVFNAFMLIILLFSYLSKHIYNHGFSTSHDSLYKKLAMLKMRKKKIPTLLSKMDIDLDKMILILTNYAHIIYIFMHFNYMHSYIKQISLISFIFIDKIFNKYIF